MVLEWAWGLKPPVKFPGILAKGEKVKKELQRVSVGLWNMVI
jgi:hypothetical protein